MPLTSADGAVGDAGPQLDLPHDVTPKQLETLLNGLLAHAQDERLPYSFFVEEQQLAEELGAHLLKHKARVHTRCRCPVLAPAVQGSSRSAGLVNLM